MSQTPLRTQLSSANFRAEYWEEKAKTLTSQRDVSQDDLWERVSRAEDFIRRLGYRPCTAMACNCNSWHRKEL